MLQYEIAKLKISELEKAAAQHRDGRHFGSRPVQFTVRRFVGRRLVRLGLRLASANG